MSRHRSYVYFIERESGDIKIGWTTNVRARLRAIERTDGHVTLLALSPGGYDEEQSFHMCFAHHRLDGEWFRKNEPLLAYIREAHERWVRRDESIRASGGRSEGVTRPGGTDRAVSWWAACNLRVTRSRTRTVGYELEIPSGKRVVLGVRQMLSPPELRAAVFGATGELPVLPARHAVEFLYETIEVLAANAETVGAITEPSDLTADIVAILRDLPTGTSVADLEKGSVVILGGNGRHFRASRVLKRLRGRGPAEFTPKEYHNALYALGCENLGCVRIGEWHGRVWRAPESVFADPTLVEPVEPAPVTARTGAFSSETSQPNQEEDL